VLQEGSIAGKRTWFRRVLKILLSLLALFIAGSVTGVLLFRFVPVPVTALMLARRLEAGSRPQAHAWVPLEEIAPSLGLAVLAAEPPR
jgi:monofunctional biosynthetic peptidoglycan transglycosylase